MYKSESCATGSQELRLVSLSGPDFLFCQILTKRITNGQHMHSVNDCVVCTVYVLRVMFNHHIYTKVFVYRSLTIYSQSLNLRVANQLIVLLLYNLPYECVCVLH